MGQTDVAKAGQAVTVAVGVATAPAVDRGWAFGNGVVVFFFFFPLSVGAEMDGGAVDDAVRA